MIRRPEWRFARRLALTLGKGNVGAMLRSMSSSELTNWIAFAELEPFGSAYEDHRFGVLTSTVANFAGKIAKKLLEPGDFFPARGVKPLTLSQRIVAALGGAPKRKRKKRKG